jgi:Zn finger protein HypA/HybF involved in hydrogenase expression
MSSTVTADPRLASAAFGRGARVWLVCQKCDAAHEVQSVEIWCDECGSQHVAYQIED